MAWNNADRDDFDDRFNRALSPLIDATALRDLLEETVLYKDGPVIPLSKTIENTLTTEAAADERAIAIQALIAAAPDGATILVDDMFELASTDRGIGGRLDFSEASIRLDDRNNITFQGLGPHTGFKQFSENNNKMLRFLDCHNIVFRDMKLDGSEDTLTDDSDISEGVSDYRDLVLMEDESSDFTFERVVFTRFANTALVDKTDVTKSLDGLNGTSYDSGATDVKNSRLTVHNCRFLAGKTCLNTLGRSSGIVYSHNHHEDVFCSVKLDGQIENAIAGTPLLEQFETASGKCVIDGNTFRDCGSHAAFTAGIIEAQEYADGIIISNNVFENIEGGYGIAILPGQTPYPTTNVIIVNNIFNKFVSGSGTPDPTCIRISMNAATTAQGIKIDGNIFSDLGSNAILLESSLSASAIIRDVEIQNNTFQDWGKTQTGNTGCIQTSILLGVGVLDNIVIRNNNFIRLAATADNTGASGGVHPVAIQHGGASSTQTVTGRYLVEGNRFKLKEFTNLAVRFFRGASLEFIGNHCEWGDYLMYCDLLNVENNQFIGARLNVGVDNSSAPVLLLFNNTFQKVGAETGLVRLAGAVTVRESGNYYDPTLLNPTFYSSTGQTRTLHNPAMRNRPEVQLLSSTTLNVFVYTGRHVVYTGTAGTTLSLPNTNGSLGTLPPGWMITVVDGGGNAGTNPIVIHPFVGDVLNGDTQAVAEADLTIATNYGSRTFIYRGAGVWNSWI